jgi:branched-chain amino acid aminotransferase
VRFHELIIFITFRKGDFNLDYSSLGFKYHPTDYYYIRTFKDGHWDEGKLTQDRFISISIFSQVLHYSQEAFEGLKAYATKDGSINLFRPDMNAKRLQKSCRRLLMPEIPEQEFITAVIEVVKANRKHVPPYASGASLYIRPVIFGIGDNLGVNPASEFMFIIMTSPVGPYFKGALKPVRMLVSEYDRAAPFGTGDIKTGGNYAASLLPNRIAKQQGFADCIYLDPATHTKIDEVGAANFFGITKNGVYVSPASSSILPSVTQDSLKYLAMDKLGLKVEERDVYVDKLDEFAEIGACGTAAAVTPIYEIVHKDKIIYSKNSEKVGFLSSQLSKIMNDIKIGNIKININWTISI